MPTDEPDRTGPPQDEHPTPQDGHHSVHDLRRELDGRTDAEESARITGHLDACDDCTRRLDELAGTTPTPAVAADQDPPSLDPRWMRRAVARTMLSVAWRAALLLVVVVVAAQFAATLLVHPPLVERGDRLERHVVASIDLPILLRPGAEARDVNSNVGLFRRTTEVRFERAVGAATSDLGRYETRLGPLAMTTAIGSAPITTSRGPRLSEDPADSSPVPFDPERAGDATAATIELSWSGAIDREAVAALTDDHDDVALTWVGFRVAESDWDARGGVLGYNACSRGGDEIVEGFDLGNRLVGGGFSISGVSRQPLPPEDGVAHALEQVRRATDNLVRSGWLADDPPMEREGADGPLTDLDAVNQRLAEDDPEVVTVVLTGPTPALAAIIADSAPDTANLLELDLDRGAPEPCG